MTKNIEIANAHLERVLALNTDSSQCGSDFLSLMGAISMLKAHLAEAHNLINDFFQKEEDDGYPEHLTSQLYAVNCKIGGSIYFIDKILLSSAAMFDLPKEYSFITESPIKKWHDEIVLTNKRARKAAMLLKQLIKSC